MSKKTKIPSWKVRREGSLKTLNSNSIIREMIFYDTETFQQVESDGEITFPFRLGYAVYISLDKFNKIKRIEEKELWKIGDFVDFIHSKLRKKKTLYIFAHNQQFDTRVLHLPFVFKDLGYKVELPIINMRTFIWKIATEHGNMTFLDTANYAVSTVDNLGIDMGYPKLKVDFETINDIDLMRYCKRDVEIIKEFILNLLSFIDEHKLGSFRNTLASLSLSAFRTRFMDRPPHIHTNQRALSLERDSYFGGRTEAWFIGYKTNQDFYALDVNSMYPYVMAYDKLPIRLFNYIENPFLHELKTLMENFYCIAKVKLNTDENCYPLRDKGKLLFPKGEFITTLSHPELENALENDHITKIYELTTYYTAPIFREFVNYFYDLRQEYTKAGNMSWRFITKIMLNSPYGKFAQQEPHREYIGIDPDNLFAINHGLNYEDRIRFKETTWFSEIFLEYKKGETTFSFPGLSSAITAYGRMLLWEYIKIAGQNNVFYMDTDSLIVNAKGYKNLADYIDSHTLGLLKIEAHSTRLIIHGAKDYRMRGKKVRKGLKKSATRLDKNLWSQLQFEGMLAWLNKMYYLEPSARYTTKRRRQSYNKGVKQSDGFIIPHCYQVEYGKNLQLIPEDLNQ